MEKRASQLSSWWDRSGTMFWYIICWYFILHECRSHFTYINLTVAQGTSAIFNAVNVAVKTGQAAWMPT